jgi:hypothetical protein
MRYIQASNFLSVGTLSSREEVVVAAGTWQAAGGDWDAEVGSAMTSTERSSMLQRMKGDACFMFALTKLF